MISSRLSSARRVTFQKTHQHLLLPCARSERKECHCMLFLTEDNDFAGKEQVRRDT